MYKFPYSGRLEAHVVCNPSAPAWLNFYRKNGTFAILGVLPSPFLNGKVTNLSQFLHYNIFGIRSCQEYINFSQSPKICRTQISYFYTRKRMVFSIMSGNKFSLLSKSLLLVIFDLTPFSTNMAHSLEKMNEDILNV